MRAEDPFALWIQICLRRFAFDFIAQGVLPLIAVRQIKLIEQEQSERQTGSEGHYRHDQAIQTNPGSINSCQLIRLMQETNCDKDGDEKAKRRAAINQPGSYIDQHMYD